MTRKTDEASEWFSLGLDTWQLMGEAATVMWLRTARLAAGGARGADEAHRMFAEKLDAGADLGRKLASGQGGATPGSVARTTLTHYGKRVRANHRRLSR